MSRHCSIPLKSISAAHAVIASSSSRLSKTVENVTLVSGEFDVFVADCYAEEFLEVSSRVVGTDGHGNVTDLYASRGVNDDYVHVATLTWTAGTCIVRGGSQLWSDTLAVTEIDKSFEVVSSHGTGANEMAKAYLNTNGYSRFLFIVSTLASTSLIVEVAPVGRIAIPTIS